MINRMFLLLLSLVVLSACNPGFTFTVNNDVIVFDNALYLLPQTLGANTQLVIPYNTYNGESENLITALESQDLILNIEDENATLTGLVRWEKSRRVVDRLNFAARDSGSGSEVQFGGYRDAMEYRLC